jgi:hypothetical protein
MEPALGFVALSGLPLPLQKPSQHAVSAHRLLQAAALKLLSSPWLDPTGVQRMQQGVELLLRWNIGSGLAGACIVDSLKKGMSARGS